MNNMDASEEVEHYTELAQIALTWLQINQNPDREQAQADQAVLYQAYSRGAVMTGFQVALGMLIKHGAEAQHISVDNHITDIRKALNAVKENQQQHLRN